ncbi:MAG: pilus assembly protein PilM, partial [Planctomycetes bacterium]|nr:pilus assembly protein PilM [Planctomycetota bacterium]
MRFGSKTSLGIDIFDDRIHVALLLPGKSGVQLVKSVQAELDEGVMESGNIKDPAALGRAIKKILKANGIRNSKAVVSLAAKQVLC